MLLRVSDGKACEGGLQCECPPGTIASALPLLSSADETRRPMLGLIRVCPDNISGNRRQDLEVMVHEIIHALVRTSTMLNVLFLQVAEQLSCVHNQNYSCAENVIPVYSLS